jgi:hypothetical protein
MGKPGWGRVRCAFFDTEQSRRGDSALPNAPKRVTADQPQPRVTPMRCKSCGSKNLDSFNGELAIHFCGLENVNQPTIFIFPELTICRDCGVGEFIVPVRELRLLRKGKAAGAQ